jgi:hypothetical protein
MQTLDSTLRPISNSQAKKIGRYSPFALKGCLGYFSFMLRDEMFLKRSVPLKSEDSVKKLFCTVI